MVKKYGEEVCCMNHSYFLDTFRSFVIFVSLTLARVLIWIYIFVSKTNAQHNLHILKHLVYHHMFLQKQSIFKLLEFTVYNKHCKFFLTHLKNIPSKSKVKITNTKKTCDRTNLLRIWVNSFHPYIDLLYTVQYTLYNWLCNIQIYLD